MAILPMAHVFKSNKLLIRMLLLSGNLQLYDTYYLAYLFLLEGAKPLFLCKEKNECYLKVAPILYNLVCPS